MRRKTIITRNPILYRKLSELNYKDSISFPKEPNLRLTSILKNINLKENVVSINTSGNTITIKKLKPCRFNVYKGH
jgi:hypothetical protein